MDGIKLDIGAAVKLLSGRFREASPSMIVLAALFIVKYAYF